MPSSRTDPRFANLTTDPRYRLPSRKNTHVKIDKRFARMLRDEDFSKKARVDRYGRRTPGTTGKKELERMYVVDNEEGGEEEEEEEEEEDDKGEEDEQMLVDHEQRSYDPAREGGFLSQSSSSESENESEDDGSSSSSEDDSDVQAEGIDKREEGTLEDHGVEDVPTGEITSRLAVVNLDWDYIRAVDLMAVSQSFCPPDGRVLNVAVYPSEFGKERMEREELEGPPAELFASKKSQQSADPVASSSESTEEEQDSFPDDDAKIQKSLLAHASAPEPAVDSKALRSYQLSRLRYYYAILSCSSAVTAKHLYDAMDGREYLATANFFDLRFVPDDVEFHDKARDACEKLPDGYKPQDFVTEALTHSNVRLTWDEDDKERKEAQKRAFSGAQNHKGGKSKRGAVDFDNDDLKAYIGSDSESDDASEANMEKTLGLASTSSKAGDSIDQRSEAKLTKGELARRKMREALGLPTDEDTRNTSQKEAKLSPVAEGNMQITFTPALAPSSNSKDGASGSSESIFQNKPEDVKEETTLEKYVRKEKERKARRKEKAKAKHETNGAQENPTNATTQEEATKDEEEEDPFDDPFFTDPQGANATAKKAARKAKTAQAAAEATRTEADRKKQRAELELLMDDADLENYNPASGSGSRSRNQGFDMAAIRKAEKEATRKSRRKQGKKKSTEDEQVGEQGLGGEGEDDFTMDVKDPRFASVYENHEFAIDPSNPRFSGTVGMNSLLEEGRARRKRRLDDGDEDVRNVPVRDRGNDEEKADVEVDELVRKIKRRNKAA